ncbi:hypothetical protein [Sphingobium yanoikuyae]|uniref:hypothetical protein n=1 Tax=Sphingobium yanoikuyae TaxID=13690 RepID=UPI00138DE51C|nr:hypothetical protein [Sphingobium yanoikuyae]
MARVVADWRDRRARFGQLLDCYRSGQMSEAQWQSHLADPGFKRWLNERAKAVGA